MKKLTCTFTLPSGVPVECFQLYGEHYEILTSNKYKGEEKMNELILSLLVSVGSVKIKNSPENKLKNRQFLNSIRGEDKRHILASVRQASMDYEKYFEWVYKWVKEDGTSMDTPQKVNLNDVEKEYTQNHLDKLVEIYGAEHLEFFKELNANGTFLTTPSMHRASEYSDLQTDYIVTLPKLKMDIKLRYLTGTGELFLANFNKKKISTNTLIEARFPEYQEGEKWIRVKAKDLHMQDLEYLRGQIEKHEGNVEMELRFKNPDTTSSQKTISVDLIGETAFFFPSGAFA